MAFTRRSFLKSALGAGAAVAHAAPSGTAKREVFAHGVASGDPLDDRVILWTRVGEPLETDVSWRVSSDPTLQRIVRRGTTRTERARDWTVKVDVAGLDSATHYYFQFEALGERSPIGRTRTLPVGPVERVRLAFTSCANMPSGYFNAYACIAERDDLDAVLHLGDYLYEFADGVYGDGGRFRRSPVPDRELLTLGDYRARHAQYKRDPDLQEAHRNHPFIVVWDDHEIANNAWSGGAGNHQPEEGDWEARKAAAVKAYFEWMPIRERDPGYASPIYRSFPFGDLADLIMLDTRLDGRDPQPRGFDDLDAINDPGRTLLGAAQESWFLTELHRSQLIGTLWRIVGQQVLMGQNTPGGSEILNIDQWDGYRASRDVVFDFVQSFGIENLVVLSGDLHSSWAQELTPDPWNSTRYDPDSGRGAVGVEFVTPSVTSPGPFRSFADPQRRADEVVSGNPHQKWAEVLHHGYATLTLTRRWAQSDWYFTSPITVRRANAFWAKGFRTVAGTNHLEPTDVAAE